MKVQYDTWTVWMCQNFKSVPCHVEIKHIKREHIYDFTGLCISFFYVTVYGPRFITIGKPEY